MQAACGDAEARIEAEDTCGDAEARIEAEEDAQLLCEIAAKNDDGAVRRLYRKYRTELFRFGFHVLHDQGLAEEVAQETWIKVYPAGRDL